MSLQKPFKKITGWLHLWLGLASGIILMTVALTGSLLSFEDELDLLLFHQRHIVHVAGPRLTADSLVTIANQVFPKKKINRMIIEPGADHSVEARIGGKGKAMKVAYIDPYTGKVLYKGDYAGQFFQQVRSLHRYLLLGDTGKIITGISCSICFFMVISGLVLWWPANKNAIKQRFKIKWDAKGKRLNWDLHAVTGFYVSVFLFAITLTGLVWSYTWVEDLVYKVAGSKPDKDAKVKNIAKQKKAEAGVLENMYRQTNQLYPYSGLVAFSFPAKGAQATMLQKEKAGSITRQTDQAYFDSKNGQLISKIPYAKMNAGARARRMILPIHTGTILGFPGKILYCLVGLFTASLPVSGLLIWLGKRQKSRKKIVQPKIHSVDAV